MQKTKIQQEFKIPGTDIMLEAGDEITIKSEAALQERRISTANAIEKISSTPVARIMCSAPGQESYIVSIWKPKVSVVGNRIQFEKTRENGAYLSVKDVVKSEITDQHGRNLEMMTVGNVTYHILFA